MPSIVYTVREGDTLWNIAKAYGTTVNDIARYNGIVETDVIYPGQRLRIFVPEESTPKWYVVRPGDTLTKIAEKFGTTVQRLMWLNDISDPNLIYPRQRLRIRPSVLLRRLDIENPRSIDPDGAGFSFKSF